MDGRTAMRGLLIRGMLVGLAAGVLMFVFAKIFGEPQVDKAIAFEDAQNAAAGAMDEGPPLVSRTMQASFGLLTGTVIYAAAFGGIFAIGFAAVYGRIGHARPRVTAAVLALVGFTVIFFVPFTKYPSNPPAVGNDDTIDYRTRIYFIMVTISVVAAIAAYRLGRDFVKRWGTWNGVIAAVAAYIVLIAIGQLLMPALEETPKGFQAPVIWHFRVATVGIHTVLWTSLGLGFGAVAERMLSRRAVRVPARAQPQQEVTAA
jgi:hypothetical protein